MKTTQTIMGMPITLELIGEGDLGSPTDEVFGWFRRVDDVFSTYRPESEISRINGGELSVGNASQLVQEILRECAKLVQETNGFFDILIDGKLDPSGYVKGWAIGRAAELLDQHNIRRYCINAGGDIQTKGNSPANRPWVVDIANPFEPGMATKRLYIRNKAVATSGTYERGAHIINPKTKLPVVDPLSLTVIGHSIERVDSLATAAFCMGDQALPFLYANDCEAMIIGRDRSVTLTQGFRRFERP